MNEWIWHTNIIASTELNGYHSLWILFTFFFSSFSSFLFLRSGVGKIAKSVSVIQHSEESVPEFFLYWLYPAVNEEQSLLRQIVSSCFTYDWLSVVIFPSLFWISIIMDELSCIIIFSDELTVLLVDSGHRKLFNSIDSRLYCWLFESFWLTVIVWCVESDLY